MTLPKEGGHKEPSHLPPAPSQEPSAYHRGGSRRATIFPSAPSPQSHSGPRSGSFPSSRLPSTVGHTHAYDTLEFTLNKPSSGNPGCSGPGPPLPSMFRCRHQGWGIRPGPALRWECFILPNVFAQPAQGWERRWVGVFSELRLLSFHAVVALVFYE